MNAPLDERYLIWLYSQIGSIKLKNPARTYWKLARQLYQKEFVWLIPNDDNRLEDGKNLRYEFVEENRIRDADQDWLDLGCSMLEMLVALARRLSFEADGEPAIWFWHMIETLDFIQYNDKTYDDLASRQIDEDLDRVIWRTYSPNGVGGLFPLRHPDDDQTEVEIWYQLNAYLSELL